MPALQQYTLRLVKTFPSVFDYARRDLLGRFAADRGLRHDQAPGFHTSLWQMASEPDRTRQASDATNGNGEGSAQARGATPN